MSFLFIYNYAFCFVFSLYEKSQIDVKMEREEIYVSAKLIQGPNWILLHVVCSGWIFYFSIFTMLRFRRSVRFRKTSWSRLKHFFWSPRSQTETVWPSTKHACCVGRSLYKKTPSLWPLKQLEMSPGVLKKITTTVPLCLPLQQVANEHIKVKVLCHVGYTFGLQTC